MRWNQSFTFDVKSEEDEIKFSCCDRDLLFSDEIGTLTIKVKNLINQKHIDLSDSGHPIL
jgi:C2 domain